MNIRWISTFGMIERAEECRWQLEDTVNDEISKPCVSYLTTGCSSQIWRKPCLPLMNIPSTSPEIALQYIWRRVCLKSSVLYSSLSRNGGASGRRSCQQSRFRFPMASPSWNSTTTASRSTIYTISQAFWTLKSGPNGSKRGEKVIDRIRAFLKKAYPTQNSPYRLLQSSITKASTTGFWGPSAYKV